VARSLGPYEIRSKLGRGVTAVFWRGYDPVLESEVALREPVIPHDLDASAAADFSARFLEQGRAVARLSHPGLVMVYAAEVYDGRPVLVTEIVEGENLAQVLSRGALSPASALYVLDQLLDAVAYAHAEGVIHKDIKPESVLLTRDGRVRIVDFGIARIFDAAPTPGDIAMGTPGYLAPEQAAGSEVDGRADLFAIGVLGYEMLSGENPFGASEGLSAAAIAYRVTNEPPAPFPVEALEGGRSNLRAVLGAALAKDPARRFQSAQEFRAALHGGSVPAGTVLLAVAEAKPVPVEVKPAASGSGTLAKTRARHTAAARRRRRRVVLGLVAGVFVIACAVVSGLLFGFGGFLPGGTTTSAVVSTDTTSSVTEAGGTDGSPSTTSVTLVPGTTTTTTLAPTTTTTVAPSTTTTTVKATTTTHRPTSTTARPPTSTTARPSTTTTTVAPTTTTTTEFVTPTTMGPG
jgi:hypothetical protein